MVMETDLGNEITSGETTADDRGISAAESLQINAEFERNFGPMTLSETWGVKAPVQRISFTVDVSGGVEPAPSMFEPEGPATDVTAAPAPTTFTP